MCKLPPLALLAAALLAACGGPQASLRAENSALRARVTELDGKVRRERRTARDLRNRVLVLEDRLETAEVGRDRAPGRVPMLPVVKLAAPDPGAGAADPAPPPDEPAQEALSGGYEEDGVEIVYEGEAAHPSGARPQLHLDESDLGPPPAAAPRRYDDADGNEEPRADVVASLPPPATSDRLPIMSGRVPPLSAAYRRAHAGPVLSRPGAAPAVSPAAPAAPATPPIDELDPIAEYRRDYSALRAGDHATAIAGFRAFLARWPRHDYADNAQYWLGEAYYDLRDYRTALVEFRAVVERYPDGGKTPDALLKIGYCYLSLRETTAGREVLRQLVEIHPRSNAAALARRRLEELAKEPVP